MTDYLKLAAESPEPTAPTGANPYLDLVKQDQMAEQARARSMIEKALADNPDVAAERQRLAKTSGLPLRVIERNLDEVRLKEQARAIDLLKMSQDSPVLARQMTDPTFTTLAIDDVDTLTEIERSVGHAVRYMMGAAPGGGVVGDLKASLYRSAGAFAGAKRAAVDVVEPWARLVAGDDNWFASMSRYYGEQIKANDAVAESLSPRTGSTFSDGVSAGVQSFGQNVKYTPLALAGPGGAALALGGMVMESFGTSYGKAADKNLPLWQKLGYASSDAMVEYWTEKIPMDALIGGIRQGAPFIQVLAKQLALEIPGEQLATVLQDLNEWATLNPGKPFADYVKERPDAAAQTLIATVIGTGGNVAVTSGAAKIADSIAGPAWRDNLTKTYANMLSEQLKLAGQSALRERSPEQFRAHVQRVVDSAEGASESVYVDGEVLNQLPAEVLNQLPESVREQIADAAATGDTVEIPMADVLTVAPGTPLEQVLNEHARMDPFASSKAEVAAAQDVLKQEAERVIQQAADAQVAQQEFDTVKAMYAEQITATGRYRPAVAEQMGTWIASFYTAYGSRVGMTPTQFQQRYPVRVAGVPSSAGQVIDQPGSTKFDAWFGDSKVVDAEGKPLVVYHGSAADFSVFKPRAGRYGTGVYFWESPERASEYANLAMTEGPRGDRRKAGGSPTVYPVYIRNAVRLPNGAWMVEKPTDIKSATGNNGNFDPRNPGILEQSAYHGTPHRGIDKFTTDKIGTGEGFQAFGWGLYFTNKRDIAEWYREKLTEKNAATGLVTEVDGKSLKDYLAGVEVSHPLVRAKVSSALRDKRTVAQAKAMAEAERAKFEASNPPAAEKTNAIYAEVQKVLDGLAGAEITYKEPDRGQLYEVELPDDENLLLWDKPLGQQPEKVRKALKDSGLAKELKDNLSDYSSPMGTRGKLLGENIYAYLQWKLGSDKAASERLRGLGVLGTNYPAGTIAGNKNSRARNYVVFSGDDVQIRNQFYQNAPTPRGTFNPATLELVLNPNANLSTWFHETGHFFLEVMADVASQPGAPAQIVEDFGTFLKWAGVTAEQWASFTLDQQRPYHERWAESIEQYVMEGKAPSVELQPLMRRFSAWLKSVYGSIKQFMAQRGVPVGVGDALNQRVTRNDKLAAWFGTGNTMVNEDGTPRVLYHGTTKAGARGVKAGQFRRSKTGAMGPAVYLGDSAEASAGYDDGAMLRVYARGKYLSNAQWSEYVSAHGWKGAEAAATADGWAGVYDQEFENAIAVWNPENIKSVDAKQFADDGTLLGQDPNAQPGPALQLNDDIRRVMDRMLATDEQIQQANEVAGLVPDEAADGVAEERLRKRSIADLKWAVKARDAVIAKLKKEARAIEKAIRERVTEEVDAMPEMRAKAALDALQVDTEYDGVLKAWKDQRAAAETAAREEVKAALLADNPDAQGLAKGQLLAKNKRDLDNKVDAAMIKWDAANPRPSKARYANDQDLATIADSFGYESTDAMLQAIAAFDRRDLIDGMTEQRMLEEHGDLIDERAMQAAANEAVHNEARARSLATELRTQAEMLNPRTDTGETTATGRRVTVNALVEAAKQFAANVVGKTSLRDLKAKAWQHTAAERRASKRWQEATAAGKTQDAVKAKQDQMLNHAAAKAAIDAQAEARKILDFFARVTKGNDETVVEKGRDADLVNAARAVLAAYGVQTPASKGAEAYLESLAKHDPETYNVVKPMVDAATQNAQPLEALTFDELQALHEEVQAMWFLAKRTRQMEVDGDLLDIDDVAQELYSRMEEIGIPDEVPGERGALTRGELLARQWLQQAPALLRRVEQWAEAKDGKFGGPFLRFIFQPVKDAADRYRTARLEYRKKFQSLVDNIAPMMTPGTIDAPELGYVFGRGHNGGGMAELLHAIAHTGNESNKRKLLLGRQWATELPDGTLDTGRWDAFIQRLANEGRLQREHFDFVQGVWDLLEETKPLAQKTHREVFGRYFAEVTADAFVDPFGVQRRGGYIPAQADPLLVQDADLRELLETENVAMSQAFPQTNRGFTKSRVEYNRPLKLDLRTLPQHIDKVLLFAHMEPAVRGVARVLRRPKVSQPLARIDPAAMGAMLKPWLNRSARQTVETPISADAGLNRMASAVRGRVGMALMFANVSNTLQQITGSLTASIKVKPGLMMRATAQFIANPKKFKQSVWDISPYMADRAANEVAVLSDTLDKILVNPSVWQSAEHFTRRHAYFLQIAFDNQMSPIIWTASYNQALADGVDERMAVRFADGVIRQTQGSTLPEDVSRIETGPAYARLFTQFVGYFNMMANTNATAIQQIAAEQGLRKGAGKAFYTLLLGLLAPIWVAEAIAHAMRGGPDDEDDDGWLDDWLVAVFGFGTIRGLLSGVPFLGAVGQSVVNRFNRQPADDKFSLSPTVSVLESAAGAPASVYKAIVEDKSKQRAVRDTAALITVLTGLPAMAVARPLGYAAGMADDRIDPTGAGDLARGLITGTASPESRTP